VLKDIEFGEVSSFTFRGWHERRCRRGVKRLAFDPSRKYPCAASCTAGRRGVNNGFHYRWNAQLFAAAGYGDHPAQLSWFHGFGSVHGRDQGTVGRRAL